MAAAGLPAPEAALAPAELPPRIEDLEEWQRIIMRARLSVCGLIDELRARLGLSVAAAIEVLLSAARDGSLPPEQARMLRDASARRRGLPNRATLYRWMNARIKGAAALAPKAMPPNPQPAWQAPLLHLYQVVYPRSSVAACVRKWDKHFPDIPAPGVRAAQRYINALPPEIKMYGRVGRNALRAVQPFVRRSTDGLWPMDVVTVDGHLFKAYVKSPMNTGHKIRPEITTYLDVATRKAVGFSCWLAESQVAIWAALRDMVLNPDCGVPAIHYSDNGAYRGEIHRAIMERIGSTMCFSQAYRAQSRGMIERLNSTVWVPLAREFDTYIGDDADPEHVKKALAIANRGGENLMEWEDFIDRARAALAEYNDRPHASLRGLTPNEAWAKAVAEGWRPTRLEGDGMYDILMQVVRTVRRGEITLPWGRYSHEDLRAYHGRRVAVAIHPTDGRRVAVLDEQQRLICLAERDGNVRPYMPTSMVNHGRIKREEAAIARKERDIARIRAEAAGAHVIQTAEVFRAHALPTRDPAQSPDVEDEAAEAAFNSYMKAQMQQAFAQSLDMPQEAWQ